MPIQLLKRVVGTKPSPEKVRRNLIQKEAEVGREVFGLVPQGHSREFFCLDRHTWYWQEEWVDQNGQKRKQTTRYELRPEGVVKAQDGQPFTYITGSELANFTQATQRYYRLVSAEVYGRPAQA